MFTFTVLMGIVLSGVLELCVLAVQRWQYLFRIGSSYQEQNL
jgi:hypothetical protein